MVQYINETAKLRRGLEIGTLCAALNVSQCK